MALAGKTVDDIGAVLKSRSVHSIQSKAASLRLSLCPAPEIDLSEFKRIMKGR